MAASKPLTGRALMKITNHGAWLLASTALFSGAFADAALAQTTAEPTNTLGEVVVTATLSLIHI